MGIRRANGDKSNKHVLTQTEKRDKSHFEDSSDVGKALLHVNNWTYPHSRPLFPLDFIPVPVPSRASFGSTATTASLTFTGIRAGRAKSREGFWATFSTACW